jgi:hypothetical protein
MAEKLASNELTLSAGTFTVAAAVAVAPGVVIGAVVGVAAVLLQAENASAAAAATNRNLEPAFINSLLCALGDPRRIDWPNPGHRP